MAIAMVAMLAFGGTYAYFTAQVDTMASTEFTVGKVLLAQDGEVSIKAAGTIMPGDTLIDGNIAYDNTSTVETYVAVVVSFTIGGTAATAEQVEALGVTFPTTADWTLVADGNNQVYVANGTAFKVAANTDVALTNDDIAFEADEHSENGQLAAETVQGKVITMAITAYQTQVANVTVTGTGAENAVQASDVWTAMKTVLGADYTA